MSTSRETHTCRHCSRVFFEAPRDHLWSALVSWPNGDSEIVDACVANKDLAREAVEDELRDGYQPGWTIQRIERRNPVTSDFALAA